MKNVNKYERQYFMPPVCEYDWAKKDHIEKAPIWCSVDLRDGNQALIEPMSLDEKLEFFQMLVDIGFKEIEVGFPAASETEFIFMRTLIERDMIPDDVTVQVLTQAREHIIKKTFEAVKGAPHAVIHLYNSTSVAQREQVFKKSKEQIKQLAVDGAELLKKLADETEGDFSFEYSPESFHGTEVDYAVEVCNAVLDVWQPSAQNKAIINIPATVETAMPHVFATQIEYVSKNLKYRDNVVLSLHPHNDRGCGVSDAELGLLAGADRIEGTLFGNGERTGNVDIITVAMNMYSYGINPQLDFSNMPHIREVYERLTRMQVNDRQPYAGNLVFSAFSGSHQDAINKGVHALNERNTGIWEVPYLPIDPADIGREYEPVVRINSQSGKGGVAFVMESMYGYKLPKEMHKEFADVIQKMSEEQGGEIEPEQIFDAFKHEYIALDDPFEFKKIRVEDVNDKDCVASIDFEYKKKPYHIEASGNGPLDAVKTAINKEFDLDVCVLNYSEHALGSGSHARAAAYIEMRDNRTGKELFGAGDSSNITKATIRAFFSGLNRLANK